MPAPPPDGVSSTERCLSVAKPRISMASSAHLPSVRAFPARLEPRGPGNISGKIVSTVARQVMDLLKQTFGRHEGEAAALDIDLRHGIASEGHEHRRCSTSEFQLKQVASAEILNCDDLAEWRAISAHCCKANQVSVIPLLLAALWQHRACNVELSAGERLSSLAGGDALDAGDHGFGRGAQALDLDLAPRLVLERPIRGDTGRLLGVGADADLAFEPLRRADFPEKHQRVLFAQGYSAAGCSGSAGAGSGGGAAAASAAAFAFSSSAARLASSRSMRFLPSWPFCGFERASRLRVPAASRNRSTRSVGWAPTPSQCLTRSSTSFTRSPLFGKSGS